MHATGRVSLQTHQQTKHIVHTASPDHNVNHLVITRIIAKASSNLLKKKKKITKASDATCSKRKIS
jgi:hypothetical protein